VNQQNKTYKVLGLMSGTSLDGIDLCLNEFKLCGDEWSYSIIATQTEKYSNDWKKNLSNIESKSAVDLVELDFRYGKYLGAVASKFLLENNQSADAIASHGHTIFHQIEKGFTYQLGNGASIAAACGTICVSDFRSLDVALGGQGAPLVPFGDEKLFGSYNACVNLGGIANLSFKKDEERIAFDVCACNMVLNYFMIKFRKTEFDMNGKISRTGKLIPELYTDLNKVDFFKTSGPKSLGKEWVFEKIIPLIETRKDCLPDQLFTFTKHIAFQIASTLKSNNISKNILFTGGGSKNKFLIELLQAEGLEFELPPIVMIDFKEALIFAFLGLKRILGETNTLSSVTGASKNSCGGSIYLP
jgi:anhydro-N-acetylmuramic acid kinase